MTTLLIGGTGKTGLKLAHLLHAEGHPVLLTSRSGVAPAPFSAVSFDWFIPGTFGNPFTTCTDIIRVYIVGPPALDALPHVQPFIELARAKGVRLFVVLGASMAPSGGLFMGKVQEYLVNEGVRHCVLRPTSFMENFTRFFVESIKKKNEIFSVVGDGRIPFVATQDVAQAAFDVLTSTAEKPPSELFVAGPKLFSYDEVAQLLTTVLNRPITHKRLSTPEAVQVWTSMGLPEVFATALVAGEAPYAAGSEEAKFRAEGKIVGTTGLQAFFEEKRGMWVGEE